MLTFISLTTCWNSSARPVLGSVCVWPSIAECDAGDEIATNQPFNTAWQPTRRKRTDRSRSLSARRDATKSFHTDASTPALAPSTPMADKQCTANGRMCRGGALMNCNPFASNAASAAADCSNKHCFSAIHAGRSWDHVTKQSRRYEYLYLPVATPSEWNRVVSRSNTNDKISATSVGLRRRFQLYTVKKVCRAWRENLI